jgi:dTDP-glucose pyrophosphorylase
MTTVIMPMAGLGSRFSAAGETRPKPLIPVLGTPMFRLALASVRQSLPGTQGICIVLESHCTALGIDRAVEESEPAARVVAIPRLTGGALETCLAAEPLVRDLGAPAIVLDCDLTFSAPAYFTQIAAMATGQDTMQGLLLSFRAREDRFSFAEVVPGTDEVIRTAEKQVISDRALVGAYGFASARLLFATARKIVSQNERTGNGEFYVSSAFNTLLRDGGTVRVADVDSYWSMGTPAELADCLADPAFVRHVTHLQQSALGAA